MVICVCVMHICSYPVLSSAYFPCLEPLKRPITWQAWENSLVHHQEDEVEKRIITNSIEEGRQAGGGKHSHPSFSGIFLATIVPSWDLGDMLTSLCPLATLLIRHISLLVGPCRFSVSWRRLPCTSWCKFVQFLFCVSVNALLGIIHERCRVCVNSNLHFALHIYHEKKS